MAEEVLQKLADMIADGEGEFDLEKLKAFFAPLNDDSGEVSRDAWTSLFAEKFDSDGELAGKIFDRFDADGSGAISADEIAAFFETIAAGAASITKEGFMEFVAGIVGE